MIKSANEFQQLMKELFQFNSIGLGFGIYRIMNYKKAVIKKFISEDLPKMIATEISQSLHAAQAQTAQILKSAKRNVPEDALDNDGNIVMRYQKTKAGKSIWLREEKTKLAKTVKR